MNLRKTIGLSILCLSSLSACGIGDGQAEATLTGNGGVLGVEGAAGVGIGADVGSGSFFSSRNNSAVLRGDALGRGVADTGQLRKIVPVRLDSSVTDFIAEKAYIAREGAADEKIRVIVPVRNVGSRFQCFVQLKGIVFRDVNGRNLAIDDTDFVEGSVGRSTLSTNTCLAPGEAGYSLMIEIPENGARLFSDTRSIDVLGVSVSPDRFEPETTRVLPRSYVVVSSTSRDYLINVENLGDRDVIVNTGGMSAVILDDGGFPLFWDFLRFPDEQENLANGGALLRVGASLKLLAESKFGGVADKVRPIINFDRSQSSPRRGGGGGGNSARLARARAAELRQEAETLLGK